MAEGQGAPPAYRNNNEAQGQGEAEGQLVREGHVEPGQGPVEPEERQQEVIQSLGYGKAE